MVLIDVIIPETFSAREQAGRPCVQEVLNASISLNASHRPRPGSLASQGT
jgi:hypothetical protein